MKNKLFSKIKAIGLAGILSLSQLSGNSCAEEAKKPTYSIDLPTGRLELVLQAEHSNDSLIHVKQRHLPPTLSEDSDLLDLLPDYSKGEKDDFISSHIKRKVDSLYSEEIIGSVNRCQEQIYNFLVNEKEFFGEKNKGLPEKIYSEGISFGEKGSIEDFKEGFNLRHKNLYSLIKVKEKKLEFNEYLKNRYYAPGAVFLLANKGVEIRGADLNEEEGNQEFEKYLKGDSSGLMEKREGYVMKKILNEENSTKSDSIKYLIYGSYHEFKDDVGKWNLENPNRKYNFLTFTPKELLENSK